MPYGHVDFTIRDYQRKLDAFEAAGLGVSIYRQASLPGQSLRDAAVSANVPLVAAQYLLKATVNKMRSTAEFAGHIASAAGRALLAVEGRGDAWNSGMRGNEFTADELRSSRGSILGKHSGLYKDCKTISFGMVSVDQWGDVQDFIRMAESTLAKRIVRKQRYLEKREKDNRDWERHVMRMAACHD
jgi:hypothetical protein